MLQTLRNIGIDIDSELAYYRTLSTEDWTDRDYFETLTRTVFSGIRNNIIEDRWNAISDAFSNFDFHKVAKYDENKLQELMENEAIIRHIGKIKATVFNAKKMVEIVKEYGSFKNYLNSFSSIGELVEKLQGYYGGFQWIGERNVYEFLKEIGIQTIKPDLQVKKVLLRLGLIDRKASTEKVVDIGLIMSKEVNERPCSVDWLLWRFGSEVCRSKSPLCEQCLLSSNFCLFFNLSC